MNVDWNSREICVWKEKVTKEQQDFYELRGKKWFRYKPCDYIYLKRNIGYAVYGYPKEEPNSLNDYTGYERKELKFIDEVLNTIIKCKEQYKHPEDILLSFLYVYGKADDGCVSVPVIRFCGYDSHGNENNIFIDYSCRVYKNWSDYLKCNKLPELILCYPKNGVYETQFGKVQVEFGISPAGNLGSKVIEGLDITTSVLGVTAVGVGTAAMFVPMAWPFIAGAIGVSAVTGVYGIGRSTETLVDRHQHEQSIGLDNAESRNCWLGIGGGIMSIASGGTAATVCKLAEAGKGVTVAGQIAVKSVTAGSCAVNSLAVINGLANIIEKHFTECEVSSLDVVHFTSSVLFFTNSVISTHVAYNVMNNIGKNSMGQIDVRSVMKQISSNAQNIEGGVANVTDVSTFPALTIGSSFSFVNKPAMNKICDICKFVCRKLVAFTKRVMKGVMSMPTYIVESGKLLDRWWEEWNEEINGVIIKICGAFGVKHWSDIIIQGHRILTDVARGQMREIAGTVIAEENSLENCGTAVDDNVVGGTRVCDGKNTFIHEGTQTDLSYRDEVINIHSKFVDSQICRNPNDFFRYLKFVCKFVQSEVEKEKLNFDKMWTIIQKLKPDTKIEEFYKEYGISGNANNYFLQEVLKGFKDEEKDGFFKLNYAYNSQNAATSAKKETEQSFFFVDGITFRLFNKRGLALNGLLSEEQFYMMAVELTGNHVDRNDVSLYVDGTTAVMQVIDGTIITVKSYLEDGKVSGVAAVLKSPQ